MKVTHHDDEHLLCLTSDEVALLVDLCHAATFSDLLPSKAEQQQRRQVFMAQVQSSLLDTAQAVWVSKRAQASPVA